MPGLTIYLDDETYFGLITIAKETKNHTDQKLTPNQLAATVVTNYVANRVQRKTGDGSNDFMEKVSGNCFPKIK